MLQISTVNLGLAIGWSAVVLSFGKKGWRKSLPHSLGKKHRSLLLHIRQAASDQPIHIMLLRSTHTHDIFGCTLEVTHP